jgi:hypothetical protein
MGCWRGSVNTAFPPPPANPLSHRYAAAPGLRHRHPDHRPRPLVAPPVLARIALGGQGIRVGPADWPTPSSAERRKLLRDALRLTLWRATGSTWLGLSVISLLE